MMEKQREKEHKTSTVQYDGSKNDLAWRIDFKYLEFVFIHEKYKIHIN